MDPRSPWITRTLRVVGALLVAGVAVAWAGGQGVVPLPGSPRADLTLAAALILFALPGILCGAGASKRTKAVSMALVAGAVMLSNDQHLGTSDNTPAAMLPFTILRQGTVYFDAYAPCIGEIDRNFVRVGDHWASQFPLTAGVLAIPIVLPAVFGSMDPCVGAKLGHLTKAAGVVLMVIGLAFLFLLFLEVFPDRVAIRAAAIVGLGTPVLSLLGQSLYQHTASALAICIALYGLVVRRGTNAGAMIVGAAAGLVVASRAVDVFLVLGLFAALAASTSRRQLAVAIGVSAVPVLPVVIYQWLVFGSPLATGYGTAATAWTADWITGFSGLFVSPGRGLFVLSPVLAMGVWPLVRPTPAMLERLPANAWRALGVGVLVHACVLAKWWAWHGAWCNSARMMSETVPILAVGMAAALPVWMARRRVALAVIIALSIAPTFAATFTSATGHFRSVVYNLDRGPWSWSAYPVVAIVERE